MERFRYFFAGLALAGFLMALAVHVAALAGIDASAALPAVWGLHVGIFIVFVPFVFASRRLFASRRPSFAELRSVMPVWATALCTIVMVYAFVNFFVATSAMHGGSPELVDGRYVVMNHGQVVRESSLAEYQASNVAGMRAFSGHWLLFYFWPFAFFAFARSLRPQNAAALGAVPLASTGRRPR